MSVYPIELAATESAVTDLAQGAIERVRLVAMRPDGESAAATAAGAAAVAAAVAVAADADAAIAAQALTDARAAVEAAAAIAAAAAGRSQAAAQAAAAAAAAELVAAAGVADAVAAAQENAITAAACARAAALALTQGSVATVAMSRAEITHQMLHDHVTGLPNLVLIRDRLSQALARATRAGNYVGVIVLDLDNFKAINDRFGRDGADDVLVGVAARLRECLRAGDTAGRLGGDEFVMVCENLSEPAAAVLVAARIEVALGAHLKTNGQSVRVGASIGIATGAGSMHPAKILRDADAAMMRAKAAGKGCYKVAEAIETRPFNLQDETW